MDKKKLTKQFNYKWICHYELKKKHGNPVAWSVEDHGEYYIFKCILTSLKMIVKITVVQTAY